jgi:hypothetical protein
MPWRVTASAGATVRVSPTYPPDTGPRWAAFFASLIHGDELSALSAYIATPNEIGDICGGSALGCYGRDRLYVSDDAIDGVPAVDVAAHEYGHHVAYNRSNAPWSAIEWGTKRWATVMGICARVANATATPGDEGSEYTFNPGEGFAESYRVLNGYGVGEWSVVDTSFRPSSEALEALRADVLVPWTQPTTETIRVRFGSRRVWTRTLTTPLDGTLTVHLRGRGVTAQLLSGGRLIARGASMEHEICGERTFTLRLARGQGATTASVEVSRP